jgi:heat shock protein HtpX
VSTGARVITQPQNETERWLVDTVRRHAQNAGIGMPEVAIYDAPEMNAFATGMTKNSSLVAVSSGLLQQMDREQVKAVLGHEIGHVANGDMVTLTLIQGVLNTLVILAARIVGRAVDSWMSGGRRRQPRRRWHRLLRGGDGAADRVRPVRLDDRGRVLALARVPRRCRRARKFAGRGAMISALQRLQGQPRRKHLAQHHRRVRHLRPVGRRLQAPLHEPSTAGRAHRALQNA